MPNTRLAAIMFTDIVGYTAMMQRHEAEGVAKAQLFRKAMEDLVQKHHGKLLEIRGAGSLSTFGSAVDAVRCALEIQTELKDSVPLAQLTKSIDELLRLLIADELGAEGGELSSLAAITTDESNQRERDGLFLLLFS